MFREALFLITKNVKTTHQLMNGNKIWYYLRNGRYSATEKNDILIYTTIWMNFESFMLNGRSQSPKYYILYDPIYVN